jgi:hypothetical protein
MHIVPILAVLLASVSLSEASLYTCELAGDLGGAAPPVWQVANTFWVHKLSFKSSVAACIQACTFQNKYVHNVTTHSTGNV